MTESLREGAPEGHAIIAIEDNSQEVTARVKIKCECGANWTVPKVTYERGIDHIDDHWHYANKKASSPD